MTANARQPRVGALDGFVPFPADRAAAYRAAGYWAGRPLDTILGDAARRWPHRTAVLDAANGAGLSYAQLDARARAVGHWLAAQGAHGAQGGPGWPREPYGGPKGPSGPWVPSGP